MKQFIELECLYTGDTILINIDSIDAIIKITKGVFAVPEYSKLIIGNNTFTILQTVDEIINLMRKGMQSDIKRENS